MAKFSNPLDNVKIAAPCSADWNEMFSFEGERVRFCSQCNLNVYNLSAMTRNEAEALLTSTEGRLCVRFYRRADGAILTQNCPIGLRAIKRRVSWAAQAILGMVLSLLTALGLNRLEPEPFSLDDKSSTPSTKPGKEMMGALVQTIEQPMKHKPTPRMTTKRSEQGKIISPRSEKTDQ